MSIVGAGRRLPRFFVVMIIATLPILVAPLAPNLVAQAVADGSATTVTGSWFRYDPIAAAVDTSVSPSVTVDQTTNLVDQVVHLSWKGFTPTSNDILYSSVPAPPVTNTTNTALSTLYPVEVFECRGANPRVSPYNNDGTASECYGAPVDSPADGGHGQNNAALGVTQADGTGSLDFHVETRVTNDLLGCDSTHQCSLVVVPNNGGRQPTNPGTAANCDDHSSDFLAPPDYDQFDYFADGAFVGKECSWADRITIPLSFAPIPTECPAANAAFSVVGSPMLQRGLSQWQAGWCRGNQAVAFNYNSTTDEYQARGSFLNGGSGALTASTDMALVTRPVDPASTPARKFTYAPLVNNAIAIAYQVDNAKTGLPITDLRLDARLVAKLLTQSYQPFHYNCQSSANPQVADAACAPEVAGNPQSILDDPEFQQLNFRGDHPSRDYFPSDTASYNNDVIGGDFASVLAGNSDLTYELTRWIAADPDAASFLAGKPDPWGMHINAYYLPSHGAPSYPISLFQPLDQGWTASAKQAHQRFTQGFQGTWNPVSGLDQVAKLLVGDRSTVQQVQGACQPPGSTDCNSDPSLPITFPRAAPEPIGVRDLWAVVDNASAQAYQFPAAALVNSAGVAVAPTTVSMSAALADMKANPDKITRSVDHSIKDPAAYPLTEVDYAMVPTCGLPAAKVSAISSMLRRVVNSQTYGVQPGTIAPGLQALNQAQLAQTTLAANQVSSAACTSSQNSNGHGDSQNSNSGGSKNTNGGSGSSGGGSTGASGGGSTSSAGAGTGSGPTAAPIGSTAPNGAPISLGFKPAAAQTQSLSMVLPLILLLGAALLVAAPATWLLTTTTGGQNLVRRVARRP